MVTDPMAEAEFLLAVLYTVSVVTVFGGVLFVIFHAITLWPGSKP